MKSTIFSIAIALTLIVGSASRGLGNNNIAAASKNLPGRSLVTISTRVINTADTMSLGDPSKLTVRNPNLNLEISAELRRPIEEPNYTPTLVANRGVGLADASPADNRESLRDAVLAAPGLNAQSNRNLNLRGHKLDGETNGNPGGLLAAINVGRARAYDARKPVTPTNYKEAAVELAPTPLEFGLELSYRSTQTSIGKGRSANPLYGELRPATARTEVVLLASDATPAVLTDLIASRSGVPPNVLLNPHPLKPESLVGATGNPIRSYSQ